MVLRDDDESGEPAVPARARDLVGVEMRRRENLRVFVAIAPFAVGIGVETPVDDSVDFAVARRDARGQRRAWFRNRA